MKYHIGDMVLFINISENRMPMIGVIIEKSKLFPDTYSIEVCRGTDGIVVFSAHEKDVTCRLDW